MTPQQNRLTRRPQPPQGKKYSKFLKLCFSFLKHLPSHKREDCPLDKDQLGRASWLLVHTMAAYYPETPTAEDRTSMGAFVRALGRFYPCESCAEDFRRDIEAHPPDTSSRTALAAWWCQAHNRVNRKLGKTEFDCSRVDERWLDGWKDGSCG